MSIWDLIKKNKEAGLGHGVEREAQLSNESKGVIAVFGTRIGGAYELADGFEKYIQNQGVDGIDVRVLRDAGLIEQVFDELGNSLKGVILLPYMRQYSPETGAGMTLESFTNGISDFIENLCSEKNIPLLELRGKPSNKQITEKIKQLTSR